jgi:hypothetical protein
MALPYRTNLKHLIKKEKKGMENLKISNSEIVFRIDVDFKNCEVDMVYKEMTARGVQTPVPSILTNGAKIPIDKTYLPYTPSEASVDFCLHWLAGYVNREEMCTSNNKYYDLTISGYHVTELEEIGLKVENWYGLMMGCCHLNCSCDPDIFSMELVKKANKIVDDIFKKYCVYYETKIEQLQLF